MKIIRRILITVAFMLPLVSCIEGEEQGSDIIGSEVEFYSVPDVWTYISMESGTVVGTGKVGDASSDAEWAMRRDWDIAICDTLIRTNGGNSGGGYGGISTESGSETLPDIFQEVW